MIKTRELRQAIKTADISKISVIIESAAGKEIRLTKGWTPLHVAARSGNRDVVTAILEAGVSINATTEMHQTALDVALQFERKGIADLLVKKGALHGAALSLHSAASAGDLKAVKRHIATGADVNQLANGKLSVCLALARRHWDIARYLLNQGCDVTKRQQSNTTPLHIAAIFGAPEFILRKLLKLGAEIDATDGWSYTPLCNAAQSGHREIVDWLIDRGADITHGQVHSSTPVYCALRGRRDELATHLIDRGAKATLHQAVQCNHLALARQQLSAGADANSEKDPHVLNTPLETAIWNELADMVTLLLEFGADPNLPGHRGDTPLHQAVYTGSAKMVKLLLAHGADQDIPNADGLTPIELARRRDRIHLANMMDADLDRKLSLDAAQRGVDQLYTVQKVAELLSVNDAFVLELIKTHKITGLHLDTNTLRIHASSVQRYLAKLTK